MLSRCSNSNLFFKLLLLCGSLLLSLPGGTAPVLSEHAKQHLESTQTIHCLLVLDSQADVKSMKREFKQRNVAPKNRHQAVVEELKLIAEATQYEVISELESLQETGAVVGFRPFYVSNLIAVECLPSVRPSLEKIPGVQRVEEDEGLELIGPIENDIDDPHDPSSTLDDPNGLYQIRANKAWEFGVSGNGVLLANIDTGVDGNHPALSQHWRGSLGYPASECWLDLYEPILPTPYGYISHGTQTMGIMCGMEPGDTVGVAWGATFIAAQIDLLGPQLTSHALQALEWMLDPDGNPGTFQDVPRIISNSWGVQPGTDPCSDTFYEALDNCEAAGIAIVWAAGNEGPGLQTIRKPANRVDTPYGAFAVGNYNYITNDVDVESSRGPSPCSSDPELRIKPDVIAPGKNVRSTTLNSGYGLGSGTSFAAPHVAGTMALMLEINPFLDPDSLKELIALTAYDMNAWGADNNSGHGCLDAYFAVYSAATGIGWVEGVIRDELGMPVQAEIYLPEHPHRFTSDESGHFIFAVPAWLTFEIQVVVPTQEIYTATLQANPQDTLVHDIDLIESLNGTLTGTVIDCQGQPATDALVEVLNAAVPNVNTDANGRFIFSLPQGFYHLRASSPACGQTVVNNIQVITGGATDIEIVLPQNPNFRCSDPDGYGYYVCDSNDPAGPVFDWTGLAGEEGGNGVQLNLYDDSSDDIILPFPVDFYGESYDRLWINANGNISFGSEVYNYLNEPLPLMVAPAVFGFWDDFDDTIDGPGGSILSRYEPESAMFVVEWYQIPRYRPLDEDAGRATFQIRVYDSRVVQTVSGNSVFEVMYGDIDSANTCTIGLDAANGTHYLPYVHDGQYELHASPVSNGLSVRFADSDIISSSPSLSIEPLVLEVSLESGQSIDTIITLTNFGTGPLGYRASTSEQQLYEGGSAGSKDTPPPMGPIRASTPKGEVYFPPKGSEPVRMPRPSNLDQGGPDAFGYYWIDSRDAGGPAFEFTDISLIGQSIVVTGDDTTSENIELPWEFEFYDQRFRSLTVNSNGFLSFWTVCSGLSNVALDTEPFRSPFYIISAFWRDLDPTAGGSITYYHDQPTDRFIVQWTDIERYHSQNSASTFQIVLHVNGMIDISYDHVGTNSAYCIIGIKGGHVGNALPIGYGLDYVDDDMMLRIYRPDNETASCRILNHSYGVVPAGDEIEIPIRITNHEQYSGSSSWPLTIRSTDPMFPTQIVDIFMITPGEIDADLTVSKVDDNIVLNWKPFPTSYYCIYSGGPDENEVAHFEGMTADTFFTVPAPMEEARFYAIRLCTASAAGQDSE